MVRAVNRHLLAVLCLLAAACATSSGGGDKRGPTVCDRGFCATIVDRELSNRVNVDVSVPAKASLHNAWVAEPGVAPCRGGRSLNSVGTDAGVSTAGPLSLEGTARLQMSFTNALTTGSSLDLDVRAPDGPVCLRVPFESPAVAASGPDGGGG